VFSARAPDADVYVRFALELILREEEVQQVRVAVYELARFWRLKDVVSDRAFPSVSLSEFLNEVGVSEESNIGYEVAIERHSAFKAER
jgi:hypothetical protein